MKLPRESVVWAVVFALLAVLMILIGLDVFESKWTKGSLSESSRTSVHNLSVAIIREYLDGKTFHVVVGLENRSQEPALLGQWTNLRLEDRKGQVYSGSGPQTPPDKVNSGEDYAADLTFTAQAAPTFPLMLEFPAAALCRSGDHPDPIRFILEGHNVQRIREIPEASRPADSHHAEPDGHEGDH